MAQGTIFNILWQTIMEKNMKKNAYLSSICLSIYLSKSLHCKAEINTIL